MQISLNKKLIFIFVIFVLVVLVLTRTKTGAVVFDMFSLRGNDANVFVQKGNYYFNVGGSGKYDLDRAAEYFNKALGVDPNVSDAWHQLARIDFLRGDFDGALEKINTQIELHGDSLMSSYYIRGLIYGYTKEYEKAEKNFLKFFEWDRNNWAVYNDLAWIYFQQGNYEKTRQTAEGGLAHFPNNPWLLNMTALAHMNLGNNEKAKIYFQKALFWAETLTESDWHRAYPGNDPNVAGQGVYEMKEAIRFNINLTAGK
ncbi:MAG: hypothetical protein HYT93_02125 [Parcubacteria group bacterium]|nr:hypothetical protein [Parcubacteria group bacterium]